MLPNDNVSMSVGHLDHVLIVYSLMEHVTWKSPGPMYGWVGKILHPDSCTSVSSWSKMPLLSIWSVAVPLCRPLLPCSSRWHGSLPRHGLWWLTCDLHCSPLLWRLGSMYQLWKSPLVSCVPWSSDQTFCLSLQHMSWSSSCKAHDRSIWSLTQGLFCLHYWNPRDFVNNMYSQCRCREHIRRVYTMGHSTFVSLWFSWKQIFRT